MKSYFLLSALTAISVASLTGCSSSPTLGYYSSDINLWCYQDANPEIRSYDAKVLDVDGEVVSSSSNVEIKVWSDSNGGRYMTGQCQLKVEFGDIPLEGGPYTVKFSVDGKELSQTDEFDSSSLFPIPN